jgi:hypothetical protein
VYQISVRGELLIFPKMCCCCGNPKAKKRYKADAQRRERWGSTIFQVRRWCYFPICTQCHRWIRSKRAADGWFLMFLVFVLLGVVAILAALALIWSDAGGPVALVAVGLLLVAAVGFVLWQVNQAQTRRLDPGPPCHSCPVVLMDWLRNKHTFGFTNQDYYDQFCEANSDSIA